MGQLRLNPLTGRWVTVAAERVERPAAFAPRTPHVQADPAQPCPFCEMSAGGPAIQVVDNPYPAFIGSEPLTVTRLGPVFAQAPASGVHEVLILGGDHGGSWADLDDDDVVTLMDVLRSRMEEHAASAAIRYTQAIVNQGREAGASMEHPHGQLLGIPFVPGEILDEEAGFRRFEGSCLMCTIAEAESSERHRVVLEREGCLVVCPYWSGVPYELLLVPAAHDQHLQDADGSALAAVGLALRDVLRALRVRLGDLAYNVVVHTAPHRHVTDFHWHVHVFPRLTSVAGFEQGTGVMINIVPPEMAAQDLRSGVA
jgi:UDPglucose--hexose-1-phosphate uridylyltransferase